MARRAIERICFILQNRREINRLWNRRYIIANPRLFTNCVSLAHSIFIDNIETFDDVVQTILLIVRGYSNVAHVQQRREF